VRRCTSTALGLRPPDSARIIFKRAPFWPGRRTMKVRSRDQRRLRDGSDWGQSHISTPSRSDPRMPQTTDGKLAPDSHQPEPKETESGLRACYGKRPVTGLFLWTRFAGDSSGSPQGGLTAVSVEPPGAVARLGLAACAGYEPPRDKDAITITFGDAIPSRSRFAPKLLRRRAAGRPLRGPV
jgi:hypothetical protein